MRSNLLIRINMLDGELKSVGVVGVCGFFALQAMSLWYPAGRAGMMAACSVIYRKHHMADINIVQAHSLSPEKAREAAQKVADKMARDYQLDCQWEDNVLRFERNGVNGALTLGEQRADMAIRLGMFMSVFSSAIEAKVTENMRKVFAGV